MAILSFEFCRSERAMNRLANFEFLFSALWSFNAFIALPPKEQ